jgi:hypothetical protein
MIGGETLFELRTSLQLADQERTGGIGAHVSPMVGQSASSATQTCRSINSGKSFGLMLPCWTLLPRPPDPKDVSSLLQRAGFTMLTVDVEEIMMGYPSMWELMQDLKDMGEGNAIFGRCVFRVRPLILPQLRANVPRRSACPGIRSSSATRSSLRPRSTLVRSPASARFSRCRR